MHGKSITQQQVKLYMSYRNQPKQSQAKAAAKAGISERTARHIDTQQHQVQGKASQDNTVRVKIHLMACSRHT